MNTFKNCFLFLTFYFCCSLIGYSQQDNPKPINYRFNGKEKGFTDYIKNNIIYPVASLHNRSVGFSVSSISITPEGGIEEISIINSIYNSIDSVVFKLLEESKNSWMQNDTIKHIQTFYVQIVFVCTGVGLDIKIENPMEKNKYFIEPVTITAYTLNNEMIPIPNDSLRRTAGMLISSGEYEKALPFINDLIKRDPYNKDLYQYRILINSKTNNKDMVNQDLQKITNFIPGKSLDELIKN